MGLNLCGVGIPLQTQGRYKLLRDRRPIYLWVGDAMGVVIADSAIEFAERLQCIHDVSLPIEARHHVGEFLTQGCGRGCLAVGA